MAEVHITCLGNFQVALAGTVLTAFQTDKTRALFVYLTLEGRVHQRTELAQFLWLGYGADSARNSLRQVLHQLRQLLPDTEGAPWFLLTRQTVQINPAAPIQVDVLTFQQLLAECAAHTHTALTSCAPCLARLRQAVDLYQGDFLAGFTVADSDPFEEWRRIIQERLHLQTLDALTQLANAAESTGDDEGVLWAAQRQLVLEPWLEAAHRQIMRTLAHRGQRAAAIAQYQRCRQVLAEELGAEPDKETAALYEQIRSGQVAVVRTTERLVAPSFPHHPPGQPAERVKAAPWPVQLRPLLGRTDELTKIVTLLAQPAQRLVTLVGPPGVGKTRLAQEILDFSYQSSNSPSNADALDNPKLVLTSSKLQKLHFAHGIHFIDLAVLRDPALLAITIAQALTASEAGLQLTDERLIDYLRDKAMLLVLDNFEHLLPGVALLGQLLAHCPQLKLLTTSRVPLRLPNEVVVAVHPLPLPDRTQPVTLTTVAQNVAVQLFCQRAAVVVPGFTLTEALAPVVIEICRCLDGLPLAIELAAAHSRLLPPSALLERLLHVLPARLELLTSRSQGLPARQQTLRAAIAWSYDLLDVHEQRLFRQLTVFTGGATLVAMEAVIGTGNGANATQFSARRPSSYAILEGIESLLDKSLLRQQEMPNARPDGEPRVIMLETLREYGWERLAEEADAHDGRQSLQQRHAEFFLTFAERAASNLHGATQVAWLDRLALEHDNLRAALDWLIQAGELLKALRLATALRYFWRVRGYYREGCERLLQILARPETAPTGSPTDAVRAHALNAAGYLQWVQGNTAAAQGLLQEALTLGRAVPDPAATAFALRYLGLAADAQQEKATAPILLEESLAIYRTLDKPNETALALMYLGDAALGQQAHAEAQRLYQESADLLRQLGNQIVLPYALRHLGYLALIQGEHLQALAWCTESLRLNLAAGEQQGSAAAVAAVAAVAAASERWVEAARLLECVAAWLATSHAQLLPFDRLHYEQTQRLLHQQRSAVTNGGAAERLSLAQALAYVEQELVLAEPSVPLEKQDKVADDKITGDKITGDKITGDKVSEELLIPVTPSPPHLVTLSPLHNLPPAAMPLVGRSRSLTAIDNHLQQTEVNLLTLVGPGGMGKTRLAVEAGRQHLAAYTDGVWFVPLASISKPDGLAGAIAAVLGIALQGGDPRNLLLQSLRPKQLLLILDNFEHLLVADTAAELVVDLLEAAPAVQILVTSRQRLNLRREQIYTVPALSFMPNATLAEAEASAAVRLFVQALQRVHPAFQLTAANLATVLRICQLVQGMPLGLELAAANAASAPLTAIADALAQSVEFLAVEWCDLPERQRSMRAVFAWSWRLLSVAEQRALRQCAVFRGGFDYTAAQAVIGAPLSVLTRLVDKSLLHWQAAASGEGRYLLHELLRQFANEELQAAAEAISVVEQHGRYYLAYLAKRGFRLGRLEPKVASAEIQVELDNIRQAWQWATSQGRLTELDQATYAWWQFCQFQGLDAEARQSFAIAIEAVRHQATITVTDDTSPLYRQRLLAKLLAIHADYLFAQGRDDEMATQAREAIQLGAASGGVEGEIYGTFVLGRALQEIDQYQAAGDLWRQTLHLIRAHQPTHADSELLYELNWMAYVWLRGDALRFGDDVGGRTYMVQALQLAQALGKRRCELHSLSALARTDFYQGDFSAAERGFRAALDLARTLGYRPVEMGAQGGLGDLLRVRGDYQAARTALEETVRMAGELALPYEEALSLATLIRLYSQLGDQSAATQRLDQLTQLLAGAKLAKECQLHGYLAAALKAYYSGARQEALRAAEQAHALNQQGGDILFRLVDTALILGHVRAAVGQWAGAGAAFQEALAAFQSLDKPALAAEPQAGLAQIALAQNELAGAQVQIGALLPVLEKEPHAGYNNPFFIYLTAYRVLAATGDPRAASLLQQGYDLLQQDAATLDEESRQRFLTNVTSHRDLVAAYQAMQAQRDRVTSDKVTESPLHPITPSPLRDWAEMPMVDFFVERSVEVAQLTAWLTPTAAGGVPAQLISILGMGGMGKTTLAAMVTKAVAPSFAVVIWRSLLNAPPLSDLLRNWLQVLSRQTLTAPPNSLDEQLRLLLTYLQQARCLLVLDNVESIFTADPPSDSLPSGSPPSRAGVARPGYEGYDQLFQRLAGSEHQSCLLLTSREQPYSLLRAGRQAQMTGRLQVLPLAGLDQAAGYALLQSNGLHTSTTEAAQLVENYSGNPLALQIVASTIADFFGGDVAAFQQEEGQIFDGMRLVLDQQFARLSPLEREILVWLAIERAAITVPTLRTNLVQSVSTGELLEALQALQNRSLLEKREAGFTLQNVIIEYMTEYLVEQVYREIVGDKETRRQGDKQTGAANLSLSPSLPFPLSFLNRFALLKAQAREEVRQSQVRLILQPLANRLLAQMSKAQVEERVVTLVQQLQAAAAVAPGYAGGNLLNLLLHIGSKLRGRDFSHLALWQVFLAGAYAPGLNLAGADLTGAVFTQRFDPRYSFHFDMQGDLLLAEIRDQRLRLLRLRDGLLYQQVALPALRILHLYLSPGCNAILMHLADHQLALLDLTTGQLFAPLVRHQHNIWRICFSPDGRLIASGDSSGLICIWDRQSGQLVQERQITNEPVSALALAPDGMTVASAMVDGTVFLWSLTDQTALRRLQGHDEEVATLTFLDNGALLASSSHDMTIGLWDITTGELRQRLRGHTRPVRKSAATATGQWLVTGGGDHFLYVWDWQRGAPLHLLTDHAAAIDQLVMSADGQRAATVDLNSVVSLWDLAQGRRIDFYPIYHNAIMSLQFTPDGETLVSGGSDGAVYLWQMEGSAGARMIARLTAHKQRIFAVAVHPDGNLIASAGDGTGIALWQRSSGQLLHTLQGPARNISMLAISPDGQWLASSNGDGTVSLWSLPEGRQRRQLQVHTNMVTCCAFSPSRGDALGRPQQRLASGSFDHTLAIWDAESGSLLQHLHGHTNAIGRCLFSHDGRRLISISYDETLRIWDVESGQPVAVWPQIGGGYIALALHPAGEILAVSCADHALRLLDLNSGRCLAELVGHSQIVVALTFHPNGQWLASAGADETINLWDFSADTLNLGQIVCRHTLQVPAPYADMKINGVTGISEAQQAALRALGAVEG